MTLPETLSSQTGQFYWKEVHRSCTSMRPRHIGAHTENRSRCLSARPLHKRAALATLFNLSTNGPTN